MQEEVKVDGAALHLKFITDLRSQVYIRSHSLRSHQGIDAHACGGSADNGCVKISSMCAWAENATKQDGRSVLVLHGHERAVQASRVLLSTCCVMIGTDVVHCAARLSGELIMVTEEEEREALQRSLPAAHACTLKSNLKIRFIVLDFGV